MFLKICSFLEKIVGLVTSSAVYPLVGLHLAD